MNDIYELEAPTTEPRPRVERRRWTVLRRPAEPAPPSPPPMRPAASPPVHRRKPYKWGRADIRNQYRITVQLGFVLALLLLIGLFRMPMRPGDGFQAIDQATQEVVAIEEVQQTQQLQKPPPPPRPSVPIEVPNDALIDEVPLDLDVSLDIDDAPRDLPPPPPAPEMPKDVAEEAEEEIFMVVEEMPEIIGGVERLYELLEYPEMARQAGLEGRVVVRFVVEPNGLPSNPQILKSANPILDEAAIKAVMQLTFKPGKQRNRPVRVNFAVPITFRLRDIRSGPLH